MGRNRSRKGRVDYYNANRRRLLLSAPSTLDTLYDTLRYRSVKPLLRHHRHYRLLKLYEDRRRWNPEGKNAPAASFSRPRHRLRIPPNRNRTRKNYNPESVFSMWKGPSFKIGFEQPSGILTCVRRKIRKEILHAFKKTGRVGQKRPRFNQLSKISCKG